MTENAKTPEPDANRFLAWTRRHGSELRLAARTTIAALLAFGIADLLHMAQIYWAVLTAVIVMQASLGGSIKATFDRLAGTVGGAAWGVIIGLALPHAGALGLALALALAVGPLALAAALKPWLRIAPVTAIIVLMSTQAQQAGPLAYALDRVIEILLGVAVALAVSLLVLPNRAHGALATAASRALQLMSELAAVLLPHPGTAADGATLLHLHAKLRRALAGVDVAVEEARRERAGRLTDDPEPEPLRRNLNRLRLDLAMIGRATVEPLPEPVAGRLAAATADVAASLAAYFSAAGLAFAARRTAPPREACGTALRAYAAVVAELRKEGLTRNLSAADAGHLFGIAFVLDQLRRNLRDLAERVDEMAGQPPEKCEIEDVDPAEQSIDDRPEDGVIGVVGDRDGQGRSESHAVFGALDPNGIEASVHFHLPLASAETNSSYIWVFILLGYRNRYLLRGNKMGLLSELWHALPSPVALTGDITQGLWSMSLWLEQDYHGVGVILALTAFAASWVALRRR